MYPTSYYIALGTNVGNYRNNFSRAVFELSKIGSISKIANIYKSKPYGYLKQNYFYNTMVYLKSEIHPNELIKKIHLIERKLHKNKRAHSKIDLPGNSYLDTSHAVDIPKSKLKLPTPNINNKVLRRYLGKTVEKRCGHKVVSPKRAE